MSNPARGGARPGAGRPTKPASEYKHRVTFRLTDAEKDKLFSVAKKRKVSASELVRCWARSLKP